MIGTRSQRVHCEGMEDAVVVTIIGKRVFVTLSRRNLRQLNAMENDAEAHHKCLTRKDESGLSLVVQVEDDTDHYATRPPVQVLGKIA